MPARLEVPQVAELVVGGHVGTFSTGKSRVPWGGAAPTNPGVVPSRPDVPAFLARSGGKVTGTRIEPKSEARQPLTFAAVVFDGGAPRRRSDPSSGGREHGIGPGKAYGFGLLSHSTCCQSFVYDIADLYKTDVTVPVAFRVVADGALDLERRVRRLCRDLFRQTRLLERIVPDLDRALAALEPATVPPAGFDGDPSLPGGLWDPEHGEVSGGDSYDEPSQPSG